MDNYMPEKTIQGIKMKRVVYRVISVSTKPVFGVREAPSNRNIALESPQKPVQRL